MAKKILTTQEIHKGGVDIVGITNESYCPTYKDIVADVIRDDENITVTFIDLPDGINVLIDFSKPLPSTVYLEYTNPLGRDYLEIPLGVQSYIAPKTKNIFSPDFSLIGTRSLSKKILMGEANNYAQYEDGKIYVYKKDKREHYFNTSMNGDVLIGDIVFYDENGILRTCTLDMWQLHDGQGLQVFGVVAIAPNMIYEGSKARVIPIAHPFTNTNIPSAPLNNGSYYEAIKNVKVNGNGAEISSDGALMASNFIKNTQANTLKSDINPNLFYLNHVSQRRFAPVPFGDSPDFVKVEEYFNPHMSRISENGTKIFNNALGDFNGLENTMIIHKQDTSQNSFLEHFLIGTLSKPDMTYYSPALGELGIAYAYFNEIFASLSYLGVDTSIFITSDSMLRSSTNYNYLTQWAIRPYTGYCGVLDKTASSFSLIFTQLYLSNYA